MQPYAKLFFNQIDSKQDGVIDFNEWETLWTAYGLSKEKCKVSKILKLFAVGAKSERH